MQRNNSIQINPITSRIEIRNRRKISVQEIYSRTREWEATPIGMTHDIIDGEGNLPLPDGTKSIITMTLLGDWKILAVPESKKYTLIIYGGNVRSHDNSYPVDVVENVRVIIGQKARISNKAQFNSNPIYSLISVGLWIITIVISLIESQFTLLIAIIFGIWGIALLPITPLYPRDDLERYVEFRDNPSLP